MAVMYEMTWPTVKASPDCPRTPWGKTRYPHQPEFYPVRGNGRMTVDLAVLPEAVPVVEPAPIEIPGKPVRRRKAKVAVDA